MNDIPEPSPIDYGIEFLGHCWRYIVWSALLWSAYSVYVFVAEQQGGRPIRANEINLSIITEDEALLNTARALGVVQQRGPASISDVKTVGPDKHAK